MTTPTPDPVLTLQTLRNAVAGLERVAVGAGSVTEEELDTRRPGGTDYPADTPEEWLAYHAWIAGRAMGVERPRSTRALATIKEDAATDRPIPVVLSSGDVVQVQAKSARALMFLRALDLEMRAIGPELVALLDADVPADDATHASVWGTLLQSKLMQLWIWIACDGVDLPFPESSEDPVVPAWVTSVRPRDLLLILEAHLQINQLDLEILVRQFPTSRGDGPPREVADVLGALAHERGVPTTTLMCARSLRSLYQQAQAAAVLAHDAKRRTGGES